GQSAPSAQLRQQVLAARAIQTRRFARHGCQGVHCNAQLTAGQVRQLCRLTPGAQQVLRTAYDRLGLSARSHDRLLRVARTIADLAGTESIQEEALRSEEHTSELQSRFDLVCRLLLEKKKRNNQQHT